MSKIAAEQFISLSFGSLLRIHYCSHINHFYILLKVILCSSYFIPLQKSVMTQTSSFGGNGWYLSVIYIIWKIALMSFYSIFDKSGYNLHTVRCTDQKMGLTVFFSPRSSWSTVLSHCLKSCPHEPWPWSGPFCPWICSALGSVRLRPALRESWWGLHCFTWTETWLHPAPLCPSQPSPEQAAHPLTPSTSGPPAGLGPSPSHLPVYCLILPL